MAMEMHNRLACRSTAIHHDVEPIYLMFFFDMRFCLINYEIQLAFLVII